MIPDKIDVAGIEYDIKEVEGLAEEHGLCGQILYQKGIIKINSDMFQTKKEQTFVHEMLHSIFNEAGYNEQDEDMINRVSIVLYQVLKGNKLYFGEG